MKKLLPSLFIFLLFVTSCANSGNSSSVVAPNIGEVRETAINELENYSSLSSYCDEDYKKYISYIIEGRSEILESDSAEEILNILEKYKASIDSLDTNEEKKIADLEFHKKDTISDIYAYIDLSACTESEKDDIKSIILDYESRVLKCGTREEINELYKSFKNAVKSYTPYSRLSADSKNKFDQEKKDLISEIRFYKEQRRYKENEWNEIEDIVFSSVEKLTVADTLSQLHRYGAESKTELDGIKTKRQYFDEEIELAADESVSELKSMRSLSSMTDAQFNTYCDSIKEQMTSQYEIKKIQCILNTEKENLLRPYAMSQGGDYLARYKEVVSLLPELSTDFSNYYPTQLNTVNQIISDYKTDIENEDSFSDISVLYNNALNEISNVDTKEELVRNEVSTTLSALYGTNHLDIPSPLTYADNYFELANIVDFYSFYQLNENDFLIEDFDVRINFYHDDALDVKENLRWWYCEISKYSVDFDVSENNNVINFNLKAFPFATIYTPGTIITHRTDNVSYHLGNEDGFVDRDVLFDDYPYMVSTKYVAGIWNTQQLWYSLEHNYNPSCVANSVADQCLLRCKQILREIIKEGMTYEQKIFAIYKWIGGNVEGSGGNDTYEDVVSYLEGPVLYGVGQCRGYSKIYLTLLRMEGIDAYLMGSMDSGHEFILIKYNGQYYLSDARYSNSYATYIGYRYIMMKDVVYSPRNELFDLGEDYEEFFYNLYENGNSIYNIDKQTVQNTILELSNTKKGVAHFIFNYQFDLDFDCPNNVRTYIYMRMYFGEGVTELVVLKND